VLLEGVERLVDEFLELALTVAVRPGQERRCVRRHVGVDDDRLRRP